MARRDPVLEELTRAQARLLRAEQAPSPSRPQLWSAVVLTFDCARLVVEPSDGADELAARLDAGTDADVRRGPADTEDCGEEEPWWRILGNPLHRAWASTDAETGQVSLELQFRADDANPRIVALELSGGAIRVGSRGPGSRAAATHPSTRR